ncbi:MAG: ATPase, T2SS/T4P/T4SS family, partial [Anaerolineales bacterium]
MINRQPVAQSVDAETLAKLTVWLTEQVSAKLENGSNGKSHDEAVDQLLHDVYEQAGIHLSEGLREQVFQRVANDLLGYGEIQPLLDDPSISEVMINGGGQVFIERDGRLEVSSIRFRDESEILRLIDRIILPLGRRIDADNPTVDARLPDGSRVNAVIPPVSVDGPSVTIRKFSRERLRV